VRVPEDLRVAVDDVLHVVHADVQEVDTAHECPGLEALGHGQVHLVAREQPQEDGGELLRGLYVGAFHGVCLQGQPVLTLVAADELDNPHHLVEVQGCPSLLEQVGFFLCAPLFAEDELDVPLHLGPGLGPCRVRIVVGLVEVLDVVRPVLDPEVPVSCLRFLSGHRRSSLTAVRCGGRGP